MLGRSRHNNLGRLADNTLVSYSEAVYLKQLDENSNEVVSTGNYNLNTEYFSQTWCLTNFNSGETKLNCWGSNQNYATSSSYNTHPYLATTVDTGDINDGHIYDFSLGTKALCWIKGSQIYCRNNEHGNVGVNTPNHSYNNNILLNKYLDSSNVEQTSSFDNVVQINGTYMHSCALKADNSLWCWGSSWYFETDEHLGGSFDDNTRAPKQIIVP